MRKGDIILIPFPFSDLSGIKTRPALILKETDLDVIVSFITTQVNLKESTDIILNSNNSNGLKKDSLLRLTKIATIDKASVLGKLGEVGERTIKQINANLITIFELSGKIR